MSEMAHMKWWGWGDAEQAFDPLLHPNLWPFIETVLGLQTERPLQVPVQAEAVVLPEPCWQPEFGREIERRLGPGRLLQDRMERMLHAYGKSFRDIWRARRGLFEFAPDAVLYPQTEAEVAILLEAASRFGVVVIPFGGGTNIVGCVEMRGRDGRMVVSLDMRRMGRVLEIDPQSGTARIEAGASGPGLERQLNAAGVTLGHFPDSFMHSTLGGWLATRGSGMQSDRYGNPEDMVVSLRMVTPTGTIESRTVPHSAAGIGIAGLCLGAEGTLGVITEAVMRVRPVPAAQAIHSYVFPDFEAGVHAIHETTRLGCRPVMSRLGDASRTQLSSAYKMPGRGVGAWKERAFKRYLSRVRGFDLSKSCVMTTIHHGTVREIAQARAAAERVYRQAGGVGIGTSAGPAFTASKYEFPYFRDYLMERDIIADVSETATEWRNMLPLYREVLAAMQRAFDAEGVRGMIGCHVSHSYHDGASLYFTFGCQAAPEQGLETYLRLKRTIQDAFVRHGGTLSHHHAVGFEHLPWFAADVSPHAVRAVAGLKQALDPAGIMNPGKLVAEDGFAAWQATTPAAAPARSSAA